MSAIITYMKNRVKWLWYDLKRLQRLWFPEPSKRRLIKITGSFWLWRHGAKTEHKVNWKGYGWWALDIAIPRKKLAVEADGGVHATTEGRKRDIIRDESLFEQGWTVLHVTTDEMKLNPKGVRRKVRKFLKR